MTSTEPSSQSPPHWDPARDHIRVVLKDVAVEVQVGLHPWERHPERPTRLVVTVEMFAHLGGGAAAGDRGFIDYDRVRDALKAWPSRPHTPLLETLAEELVQLCFADPRVEACRVLLMKPDIFNEAAGAGIEIYRLRPQPAG
jgi:7,8-dihydroneopterin aldolase/epimerase/oxygenase